MIHCHRIVNSLFNSNTYIIYFDNIQDAYLIDCGDFDKVKEWLECNKKQLKSIFVTHSHFDHIYGINDALKLYPQTTIYLSQKGGKEIISNPKLNKSKYTETPFSVQSNNIIEIENGNLIKISDESYVKVFETPGHTSDSISYIIDNNIYTGDAFIPNIRTITKLKESNKELAKESLFKIYEMLNKDIIVHPGHNDSSSIQHINIDLMF